MAQPSKVELFRILGESFCGIASPISANVYFNVVSNKLYPLNDQRRRWAFDHMLKFFNEKRERDLIMRRLSGNDFDTSSFSPLWTEEPSPHL